MTTKIPAAIYRRVSTHDQAEHGSSLDTQQSSCHDYCQNNRLTVVEDIADDVSGNIPMRERNGGARLMQLVDDGAIRVIVVYDLDRVGRNLAHYLALVESLRPAGIELHTVTSGHFDHTPEAQLGANMRQLFAEYERIKIKERMTRGRQARAKRGLPATYAPKYYTIVRDANGRSIGYEFNETYRATLNELAQQFVAGVSYSRISAVMDSMNFPTLDGGKHWRHNVIRKILANPFNRGIVEYNKRKGVPEFRITGHHTTVWDEEMCRKVEAELQRRARHGRKVAKSDHLLSGILRCAKCGRVMIYQLTKTGYVNYVCYQSKLLYKRDIEPEECHGANSISERKAIALIKKLLYETTNEDLESVLAAISDSDSGNREDVIRSQIVNYEKQRAEFDAAIDAIASAAVRQSLLLEIDKIDQKLLTLVAELEKVADHQDTDHASLFAEMQYLRDNAEEIFSLPDHALRQALLKGLKGGVHLWRGNVARAEY